MSGKMEKPGGQPPRVELFVRNGYVITMDDANCILVDGAIAIDRGRIVAVGDSQAVASKHKTGRVVDAKGAPVHPGFIEFHMHASFQPFRGSFPDQLVKTLPTMTPPEIGYCQINTAA